MLVYLNQDNTRKKPAQEAMRITFHELGHASHDEIQDGYNSRANNIDGESWAQGIEYIYMKSFFGDTYNSTEGNETYTNLIECLLKNGFNIAQIQDGFIKSRGWTSWQGQMATKALSANTKEKFVYYIFANPNTTKYDLRKIITTPRAKISKNELGMINFIKDPHNTSLPIDIFSIDSIQFADADVSVLESDDISKYRPFMFSKPGTKTIRTHIAEFDEWYETKVIVNSSDIFDPPITNLVQGNTYSYKISSLLDTLTKASNWSTPDPDGTLIEETLNKDRFRNAAFYFRTPGKKTITFDLNYNGLPYPMTVEYERAITIDPADENLFILFNPPLYFSPNTWYRAIVRDGIKLFSPIKAVQLTHNWNYSLPEYEEGRDWTYDNKNKALYFKTPAGFIDCTLRISFDGINTATQIIVSNVRK